MKGLRTIVAFGVGVILATFVAQPAKSQEGSLPSFIRVGHCFRATTADRLSLTVDPIYRVLAIERTWVKYQDPSDKYPYTLWMDVAQHGKIEVPVTCPPQKDR
jgi:hypothetical protein